jgi:hypothetical protein
MIRVVFQEYMAKQEILKIPQVNGRTRGEAFKSFVSTIDMPLNNLPSITTDGAPSTTGSKNGFIATFTNDESFPKCISYHCVIHLEVLHTKVLPFKQVLHIVTKS